MKKKFLVPALWLLLAGFVTGTVAAQSTERIDELLRQDPAETGHVAYLVLSAAGIIPETASLEAALQAARERGMLPAEASVSDPVSFGRFSFLLMESFGISGGVMYRIIPGPRYAAREVVYQRWARTRRPPGQMIDGETAMRVLSVYLNRAAARGGA